MSTDGKGLRQAAIVAGSLLQTDLVTIKPAVARWEARVAGVDYLNGKVVLDRAMPAGALDGAFFEVGAPERNGRAAHWTGHRPRRAQVS